MAERRPRPRGAWAVRVALTVLGLALGWQVYAFVAAAQREQEVWDTHDAGDAARLLSRAMRSHDVASRRMARRVDDEDPRVALDVDRRRGVVARGRRAAMTDGVSVSFDFCVGRVLEVPSADGEFAVLIGALDESRFHLFRHGPAVGAPEWASQYAWFAGDDTDVTAWRAEPWWPDPWSPYDAADVALDEELVERFIENVEAHRGAGTTFTWLVGQVSADVDGRVARDAAARRVLEAAATRAPELVAFDGVSRVALRRPMRAGTTDEVGFVDLADPGVLCLWSAEPGERIEEFWFDGDALEVDCARHWRGARRVTIPWSVGEPPDTGDADVEWR